MCCSDLIEAALGNVCDRGPRAPAGGQIGVGAYDEAFAAYAATSATQEFVLEQLRSHVAKIFTLSHFPHHCQLKTTICDRFTNILQNYDYAVHHNGHEHDAVRVKDYVRGVRAAFVEHAGGQFLEKEVKPATQQGEHKQLQAGARAFLAVLQR